MKKLVFIITLLGVTIEASQLSADEEAEFQTELDAQTLQAQIEFDKAFDDVESAQQNVFAAEEKLEVVSQELEYAKRILYKLEENKDNIYTLLRSLQAQGGKIVPTKRTSHKEILNG